MHTRKPEDKDRHIGGGRESRDANRASHQSIPNGLPIQSRWCQTQGLAGGRAWALHLTGVLVADRGYCGGRSQLERCAGRAGTPSTSILAGTESLRRVGIASKPSGADAAGSAIAMNARGAILREITHVAQLYVTLRYISISAVPNAAGDLATPLLLIDSESSNQ